MHYYLGPPPTHASHPSINPPSPTGTDRQSWLVAGTNRGYLLLWDLRFQLLVKVRPCSFIWVCVYYYCMGMDGHVYMSVLFNHVYVYSFVYTCVFIITYSNIPNQTQSQIWRHSAKGPIHRLAAATRLPLDAGGADHPGPTYGCVCSPVLGLYHTPACTHPSNAHPHINGPTHSAAPQPGGAGGRPLLFIAAGGGLGEQDAPNEVGVWDLSSSSGRCKQCFRAVSRPTTATAATGVGGGCVVCVWTCWCFVRDVVVSPSVPLAPIPPSHPTI